MRYLFEILKHRIHGYKVWLHGRNQGRSGVNHDQGRPQDLGGGGAKKFFFSDLGICMSRSDMFAMRIARGVRGHAPPRKFFKTVQFGAF